MSRFTHTHSLHSLKRLRRLPHQSVLTGLAGRFFVRTVIIAARKKHQVVRLWAQRRRCAGTPSLGPCRPPWNNAISGRWSHVSHASHTVKNTGSTPVLHLPQSCSRQQLVRSIAANGKMPFPGNEPMCVACQDRAAPAGWMELAMTCEECMLVKGGVSG